MKEIKKTLNPPFFYFHGNCGESLFYRFHFFLAYLVPIACGSFWRVDKIQNGVTMETEVPK
jgi:hypothetical protein